MRSPLLSVIAKEARLLLSDIHALAMLFIMPLAFILIMSLAMQDMFDARSGKGIEVLMVDREQSEDSADFIARLGENDAFRLTRANDTPPPVTDKLSGRAYAFAVEINDGFSDALMEAPDEEALPPVVMTVAAHTDKRIEAIFTAALRETLGRQRVDILLETLMAGADEDAEDSGENPLGDLKQAVSVEYAYNDRAGREPPSAVQQNVPAWLVFAMFFVAIPFSTTFIRERQAGVQKRLRTINVSPLTHMIGKLAPYFVVNQIQVAVMLAAGIFLVPLLGGQALVLNGSPVALIALSFAVSIAALGLALLIAVIARTTEQSTLMSGLGLILLAAIGGVMVPKFIMPEAMQRMADLSPMAWGLDGFLELFLRGGGFADIARELTLLLAFGLAALCLALLAYSKQK